MGGQGNADDSLTWRTFLNKSEHTPGVPWPDGVSFHGCASGAAGTSATEFVDKAFSFFAAAAEAVATIRELSPSTKVFLDEVGIIVGCNPPWNMSETLGNRSLSYWWNVQAVV